eukprot:55283_1
MEERQAEISEDNADLLNESVSEIKNREKSSIPVEIEIGEGILSKGGTRATQGKGYPSIDGRKFFTVGQYDVTIPSHKVPLLGVMASGLILILTLFLKDVLDNQQNLGRYGLILCFVAFVGAFISFFMPSECTFPIFLINFFLYLWSFIGACFMTFENGPFVFTGNGYFASWAMTIFSASAIGFTDSVLDLGAATLLFLLALIFEIREDPDTHKGEIIYSTIVACVTILTIAFLTFKSWWTRNRNKFEAYIMILLGFVWITCASTVSFRGPFTETGNGYFSAWIACVISVKCASRAWEHQRSE